MISESLDGVAPTQNSASTVWHDGSPRLLWREMLQPDIQPGLDGACTKRRGRLWS